MNACMHVCMYVSKYDMIESQAAFSKLTHFSALLPGPIPVPVGMRFMLGGQIKIKNGALYALRKSVNRGMAKGVFTHI